MNQTQIKNLSDQQQASTQKIKESALFLTTEASQKVQKFRLSFQMLGQDLLNFKFIGKSIIPLDQQIVQVNQNFKHSFDEINAKNHNQTAFSKGTQTLNYQIRLQQESSKYDDIQDISKYINQQREREYHIFQLRIQRQNMRTWFDQQDIKDAQRLYDLQINDHQRTIQIFESQIQNEIFSSTKSLNNLFFTNKNQVAINRYLKQTKKNLKQNKEQLKLKLIGLIQMQNYLAKTEIE